jgi:aldose 1-epimerase
MSFSVVVDEKDLFPVVRLKDKSNDTEAVIYSFGALLNAFIIKGKNGNTNIIDGFTSPADAKENITETFKSAKLSPFVCRMQKGEYRFDGEVYKIDKFYLGSEAIHGLLFDVPFAVKNHRTDDNSAFVQLLYAYNKKEEGYPFAYSVEVIYTLKANNTLSIQTLVINNSESDMPLNDGWHPYFQLGETINELQVQFNSNAMVEFNRNLLPTGKFIPYRKFETMESFGDTFLDNCFVLKNSSSPACILKNEKTEIQLSIIRDTSYPYLQVYTPPHRKSIAIENLSSAPDSFNNGMGLIIVKAGEQYSFMTAYQVALL